MDVAGVVGTVDTCSPSQHSSCARDDTGFSPREIRSGTTPLLIQSGFVEVQTRATDPRASALSLYTGALLNEHGATYKP